MKPLSTLALMIFLLVNQLHVYAQYTVNNWGYYYGGKGNEYVEEVATDSDGNSVITGKTQSVNGLATPGAYDTSYGGGGTDAFLAKINSSGTLSWSTYFGGPGVEIAYAVSYDKSGNTYMGGYTGSLTNIATAGAYQTTYGGGVNDGFLAKFDPNGQILWSTYFGGPGTEWIVSLCTDNSNNVYITGWTESKIGISTPGAYQAVYIGRPMDCFIAKFDSNGALIFSTYFGAVGEDRPHDIHIDNQGNIILDGSTQGKIGLSTSGAYQDTMGGTVDAFLSKWTPEGQLTWSTYYGGKAEDRARELTIDANDNIYMTGFTSSKNAIATNGAWKDTITKGLNTQGKQTFDAFLVKFSSTGQRVWGTYYGGTANEYGRGLRISPEHNLVTSGVTLSKYNIASSDAYQKHNKGLDDAYLSVFTLNGVFVGGTYYGGAKNEPYDIGYGPSLDIDSAGNVYLATTTSSSNIPNALDTLHKGINAVYDAMLTKFEGATPGPKLQSQIPQPFSFEIYPNPASNIVNLNFFSYQKKVTSIIVKDLLGSTKLLLKVNANSGQNHVTLNTADLSPGLYFVTLPEMDKNSVMKLVVDKD